LWFKTKRKFLGKVEIRVKYEIMDRLTAHLIDLRLSIFVEKSVMSSIKEFSFKIYHEIDRLFPLLEIKSFTFLHTNARQL